MAVEFAVPMNEVAAAGPDALVNAMQSERVDSRRFCHC